MKCCLSSRLPKKIVEKADEIKFQYRDRNSIFDYLDYNKTIIIDCLNQEIDWDQMSSLKVLCKDDFLLCLSSYQDIQEAKKREIKWYWGFPVSSFYMVKAFDRLGSYYLKLDAPLFFQWESVKKLFPNMHFRHTPNVAYNDGLPHGDGVVGTWIRPEDLSKYDEYIDVIEFEDSNREKEETLYDIYMQQHKWNVNLDLLISNLQNQATNRMIPNRFTETRLNCGQKCEEGSSCKICYRILDLANPEKIKTVKMPQTQT